MCPGLPTLMALSSLTTPARRRRVRRPWIGLLVRQEPSCPGRRPGKPRNQDFSVLWVRSGVGRTEAGPSHPGHTSSASSSAKARKAMPRWLIAFFSSAVSSAVVRSWPSGTKTGS